MKNYIRFWKSPKIHGSKFEKFIIIVIFLFIFQISCENSNTQGSLIASPGNYKKSGKPALFPVWKVTKETPLKNKKLRMYRDKYNKQVGSIGKWGYQDSKGRLVIPHRFSGAGYFANGLAPVLVKGVKTKYGETVNRWGYIDTSGKLIVKPEFYEARPFSDGLAWVYDPDLRRSFINTQGDPAFKVYRRYTYVHPFKEGYTVASLAWKKRFFLNMNGKKVFGSKWQSAYSFNGGMAKVAWDNGNKMALLDLNGKVIIKACNRAWCKIKDDYQYFFQPSEGLVAVKLWKTKKWGYMDSSGSYVIEPKFRYAGRFSEGLAIASITGTDDCLSYAKGCKYGYINKKDKFVIKPKYDFGFPFSEGLAQVITGADYRPHQKGKRSFINRRGKYVIKINFKRAKSFFNGYAPVMIGGKAVSEFSGLWGYIDRKGRYLVPPMFKTAYPFNRGLAIVHLKAPGGGLYSKGVVDINGNIALESKDWHIGKLIAGGMDGRYFSQYREPY